MNDVKMYCRHFLGNENPREIGRWVMDVIDEHIRDYKIEPNIKISAGEGIFRQLTREVIGTSVSVRTTHNRFIETSLEFWGRKVECSLLVPSWDIHIRIEPHDYFMPHNYNLPVMPTMFPIRPKENTIEKPEKVIFNAPATICYWKDGSKTVVKCGKGEHFDVEKGLAMCMIKHVFGDKGNYNDIFRKWCD